MKLSLNYFTLLVAFTFLISCQKNQESSLSPETFLENELMLSKNRQANTIVVCSPIISEDEGEDGISHSTVLKDLKWEIGRTLNIRFMGGEAWKKQRVKGIASIWEEYANIKFNFIEDGEAEIRIAFEEDGNWSSIGRGALYRNESLPTMNLEDVTRRVVLHEFGHALGLVHEHQHPENGIQWNKEVVYNHYSNWSKEKVDHNIFRQYDATVTQYCAYDPASVMHYPIPKEHTLNGYEVPWNTELSTEDKRFIGKIYPFDEPNATEQSYSDVEYTNYFRNIGTGWTAGSGAISIPFTVFGKTFTQWLFDFSYLNRGNTLACYPDAANTGVFQSYNNTFTTLYNRQGTDPISKQLVRKANDQTGLYFPLGGIEGTFPTIAFYNRVERVNGALHFRETVIAELDAGKARNIKSIPFEGNYGSSIIKEDGYYYIYGKVKEWIVFKPIIARCPIEDIYNYGNWEFYVGENQWSSDANASIFISEEVAAAFSVFELYGSYYMLYQKPAYWECGKGREIYIYSAERPEGPFENPALVYTVEDKFDNQYAQTFGARAHPHLINEKEELLVSYNVNRVCDAPCEPYDADKFRPKFIRVPYSKFARCNF